METVYMVIKFFGIISTIASTPYTLDECEASLIYLDLPVAELQATAECIQSAEPPVIGKLSDEQLATINAWVAKQEIEL